ncbi:hypothetical protein POX_c04317 [Penicillium oxalicum]|nr:hypothetical protein POX_c04317 [Penicillium oxalicum]KAI2791456.1 hypothetical protein POX_c04317 [Penicillium oxalicum]
MNKPRRQSYELGENSFNSLGNEEWHWIKSSSVQRCCDE